MDIEAIKRRAKQLDDATQIEMQKPFFQNVVAWFVYLGLLRHNVIRGRRVLVTLDEVLQAGQFEPRILEILPALVINLPEAIAFERTKIPDDLVQVIKAIKRRQATMAFRAIPPQKYLHWLKAPVFDLAAKRLHFRTLPRVRGNKISPFADAISTGRRERALTQKQLAETHGLSLRVIRDLEQGKHTASLQSVMDVLHALDRKLLIS